MAAILHALQGILTIVIMIATGFYLSRKGWFSEKLQLGCGPAGDQGLPAYLYDRQSDGQFQPRSADRDERRSAGTDHFHGIGLFYRPCGSTAAEGAA